MAEIAADSDWRKTRLRPLTLLGVSSVGHMLNDLYSNFLPQLLPFLVVLIPGFTPGQAALLVATFNLSSSIFQPIFGYTVDGRGQSWLIYVGTLWMSAFLCLTGLAGNFNTMVLLAAAAGLGTAAFHPPASAFVHGLDARHKAVFQSIFVAFGNIGFALAPLTLVPLFQVYGIGASWLLIIPGLFTTVLLFFALPRQQSAKGKNISVSAVWTSMRRSGSQLVLVLAIIAIRSASYTGLLAMLPLFFHARGFTNIAGSRMLTLMLATGAVGGIIGGLVSDRWGRKPLIIISLVLAAPLFLLFLGTTGLISMVALALAGACLLASFSVTTVAAQDLIPEHKALAAGLSLGFSNGLGAIAAIFIGKLADSHGLATALILIALLPALAGAGGLLLRRDSGRQRA